MGCCLSKGQERHHSNGGASSPSFHQAPLEEETVKQVLLETPFIPKKLNTDERIKEKTPGYQECKVEVEPTSAINLNLNPTKFTEETISEVSEISEMCSYSESFSNTTGQEKKDEDDGEVNQRPTVRKRRGPTGGKRRVPVRRPVVPSPEKRSQLTPSRPVRGGQHRNEGPVRRSRSPVRSKEMSAPRDVSNTGGNGGKCNGVVFTEEAETLENPVVSLECFIFL